MRTVNACVVVMVGLLVTGYEIGSGNSVVIGYLSSTSSNKTEMASVLMAVDDARASGVLPNSSKIE